MPNPLGQESRVNHLLTDYSVGVLQNPEGFAHRKAFPALPSDERGGFIGRYDRGDWLRNQFSKRADGDESAGSGWKQDNTLDFFADVWALHKDVGRQAMAMAQSPYDAMRDATKWLGEQALLSREIEWAAKFFTTGVWKGIDGLVGDVTGIAAAPSANQTIFWNLSTSDPIVDIRKRITQSHLRIAQRPNKLIMGRQVWDALADNPKILERILNSGGVGPDSPAIVLQQAFASILELKEVVVMDGIQVTSPENKSFEQSLTTAFIGGRSALLIYVEDSPTLYTPSTGLTIPWTGFESGAANEEGAVISDFPIDEKKVIRVEAEAAYSLVLTQPDGGVFFTNVVEA